MARIQTTECSSMFALCARRDFHEGLERSSSFPSFQDCVHDNTYTSTDWFSCLSHLCIMYPFCPVTFHRCVKKIVGDERKSTLTHLHTQTHARPFTFLTTLICTLFTLLLSFSIAPRRKNSHVYDILPNGRTSEPF